MQQSKARGLGLERGRRGVHSLENVVDGRPGRCGAKSPHFASVLRLACSEPEANEVPPGVAGGLELWRCLPRAPPSHCNSRCASCSASRCRPVRAPATRQADMAAAKRAAAAAAAAGVSSWAGLVWGNPFGNRAAPGEQASSGLSVLCRPATPCPAARVARGTCSRFGCASACHQPLPVAVP